MTKQTFDTAIIDYTDCKIEIKQSGAKNRGLQNAIQMLEARYARKQKMVDDGKLSAEAGKALEASKRKDWARAIADHLIVGWEGKFSGKKLPEFTKENVVAFLAKEENDVLFADIIESSAEEANFEAEVQKAEEKNLSKASSGGESTGRT